MWRVGGGCVADGLGGGCDVFRLFVNAVKRLRIMKGSEQVNLGERGD